MQSKDEIELYEKAIKALIEEQYPNLVGKAIEVLEVGEQRIYFGASIPFGSYSVSKEILKQYI